MDDQCPISGAEKAFFSSGTGRGIYFIVSFLGNFLMSSNFKYLLLLSLSSPSLMHWRTKAIISYGIKEKTMKKQKMKCLIWQRRPFRMHIFHVF
jgi:hypothetical protein